MCTLKLYYYYFFTWLGKRYFVFKKYVNGVYMLLPPTTALTKITVQCKAVKMAKL